MFQAQGIWNKLRKTCSISMDDERLAKQTYWGSLRSRWRTDEICLASTAKRFPSSAQWQDQKNLQSRRRNTRMSIWNVLARLATRSQRRHQILTSARREITTWTSGTEPESRITRSRILNESRASWGEMLSTATRSCWEREKRRGRRRWFDGLVSGRGGNEYEETRRGREQGRGHRQREGEM